MNELWIIGICNSNSDGVYLTSFYGTENEMKKRLVDMVQKEKEEDGSYDYGTESIDEVRVKRGELYAYGCYEDYHVDYSAKRLKDII